MHEPLYSICLVIEVLMRVSLVFLFCFPLAVALEKGLLWLMSKRSK